MKTKLLLTLTILFFTLQSCDNKDDYVLVNVAKPMFMTKEALRSSVEITHPQPIVKSGKIYAYKNLILVNDLAKGIHIIDNEDPHNPNKVAFIKLIANNDMEIKGDFLYADSFTDLVVFDISDIHNIKKVSRLKDVFPVFIPFPSMDNLVVEYGENTEGVIVNWDISQELRRIEDINYNSELTDGGIRFTASADATTGQGGSLARFKIVNEYLYAVDSHNINIFNIENLGSPQQLNYISAGFDIETIFNRGSYLFLGSMRGMYIYDIESPVSPQFISEFQHGTACDPVVVDDDYAYITLRAGNRCGALDSSLQIVDITNIYKPTLAKSYEMDNPYGLGVNGNLLFICDGNSGLKVYDKTNIDNLQLINHFRDINTYDVIPMENHLLMIGEKVLYQYTYTDGGISLLSQFSLD